MDNQLNAGDSLPPPLGAPAGESSGAPQPFTFSLDMEQAKKLKPVIEAIWGVEFIELWEALGEYTAESEDYVISLNERDEWINIRTRVCDCPIETLEWVPTDPGVGEAGGYICPRHPGAEFDERGVLK